MKTVLLALLLPTLGFSAEYSAEQLDTLFDGKKPLKLSDLAVRIPGPSDVNPMLTDARYRPTNRPASEKNIGEARRRYETEPVRWDLEVFGGGSIGIPGEININTRGGRTPYLAARVGRWKNSAAWEIEGVNVYQRDETNHADKDVLRGYNHFLVNRAYELWGFIWRVGVGAVITHPSPTPQEQAERSSGAYRAAALGSQASIARRVYISDHAYTSLEGKFMGAVPQSRHPDDNINVPRLSGSGVLGVGFDF